MVDSRPLLFANALILMLLVSAGFANLQPDQAAPAVTPSAGNASVNATPPENKARFSQ